MKIRSAMEQLQAANPDPVSLTPPQVRAGCANAPLAVIHLSSRNATNCYSASSAHRDSVLRQPLQDWYNVC